MASFDPVTALIGGALIGLASAALMLFNGRIAGISGILGTLWDNQGPERAWRLAFVLGLVVAGAVAAVWNADLFVNTVPRSAPLTVAAGLLVGFGARLGSGCTSGHGVCGMSRLAPRSITATLTFIASGVLVVWLTHQGAS